MKAKVKMVLMTELVQLLSVVPIEPFEDAKKGEIRFNICKIILHARTVTAWIAENHPENLLNIKVVK